MLAVTLVTFVAWLQTYSFLERFFSSDTRTTKLAWFSVQHVVSTCLELRFVDHEYDLMSHFDSTSKDQEYEANLSFLYAMCAGSWLAVLVQCLFERVENRDKDHWLMVAHHLVTLLLIFLSNYAGMRAVGAYVLYLHDVSDISVAATKLIAKIVHPESLALMASFVWMVASWVYFRIYRFAIGLVAMSLVPGLGMMRTPFKICVCGLVVLSVMHAYWLKLMLELAVRKDRVAVYENDPS